MLQVLTGFNQDLLPNIPDLQAVILPVTAGGKYLSGLTAYIHHKCPELKDMLRYAPLHITQRGYCWIKKDNTLLIRVVVTDVHSELMNNLKIISDVVRELQQSNIRTVVVPSMRLEGVYCENDKFISGMYDLFATPTYKDILVYTYFNSNMIHLAELPPGIVLRRLPESTTYRTEIVNRHSTRILPDHQRF